MISLMEIYNQNRYNIFCDIDGVLANFNKKYKELTGYNSEEYEKFDKNKFWKPVDKMGVEFWSTLEWMPEGKELWKYIKKYRPKLLSAPSQHPTSKIGKKIWVKQHLQNVELILVPAVEKQKYASSNSILIDDFKKNIEQWKNAGGIGVLYKNTQQAINELNKLANRVTDSPELGLTKFKTKYSFECYDKHGNLKWTDSFENLVVTEGLNLLITNSFKTIPGSVTWFVGLKGSGTVVAGDTMSSHAGWSEVTTYDEANRPGFTAGTVASGSVNNSAAKAVFTISGTVTVNGAFLTSNNTKGGTTGSLYGAGDFGSPRSLVDNDVLNVQVDITATAS